LSKSKSLVLGDVSFEILAGAFEVHNIFGAGFLEKVYEHALIIEMTKRGLVAESQKEINVSYKGSIVGSYFADLLINDEVIVELKAVEALTKVHEAQLLNYLKTTGKKLGLLINFGKDRVEHKRLVL